MFSPYAGCTWHTSSVTHPSGLTTILMTCEKNPIVTTVLLTMLVVYSVFFLFICYQFYTDFIRKPRNGS